MDTRIRAAAGMIAVAGAIALSSTTWAGAVTGNATFPISGVDNPCTAGFDNITGTINVHGVAQSSNGTTFLKLNFQGSGTDANGLGYQLHAQENLQFHDPLPATFYLKEALVSQGSTPNFTLTFEIKVDGQGNVVKLDLGAVECNG